MGQMQYDIPLIIIIAIFAISFAALWYGPDSRVGFATQVSQGQFFKPSEGIARSLVISGKAGEVLEEGNTYPSQRVTVSDSKGDVILSFQAFSGGENLDLQNFKFDQRGITAVADMSQTSGVGEYMFYVPNVNNGYGLSLCINARSVSDVRDCLNVLRFPGPFPQTKEGMSVNLGDAYEISGLFGSVGISLFTSPQGTEEEEEWNIMWIIGLATGILVLFFLIVWIVFRFAGARKPAPEKYAEKYAKGKEPEQDETDKFVELSAEAGKTASEITQELINSGWPPARANEIVESTLQRWKSVLELRSYIREARKDGMSDEEIKRALQSKGWPESLIQKAFGKA